jgi:hypothetical protein
MAARLPGVALSLAAEITTITITLHSAAILLPIARFAGYAWLITAAALLPQPPPPHPAAASTPSGTGGPSGVMGNPLSN